MGNFQSDFISEVNGRKGDIADVVGMPDEQDYAVLCGIIDKFKQRRFVDVDGKTVSGEYLINVAINRGRENFLNGIHGHKMRSKGEAEISSDSSMRYAFELPENLGFAIEAVFPSMFRSKKHLRWFAKKFPQYTIAGKKL